MGRPKGYHSPKECRYIGVSYCLRTKKYVAQHKVGTKNYYIGSYSSAIQAAHAYDYAKYHALKNGLIGPHVKMILNFGIPAESATMPVAVERDAFHCPGLSFYAARQKFKVTIMAYGIKHFVGAYSTKPEAVIAGLAKTKELIGAYPDNKFLKRTLNYYEKAHRAYCDYERQIDEDIVTMLMSEPPQAPLMFSSRAPSPLLLTVPRTPTPGPVSHEDDMLFPWESPSLDL